LANSPSDEETWVAENYSNNAIYLKVEYDTIDGIEITADPSDPSTLPTIEDLF